MEVKLSIPDNVLSKLTDGATLVVSLKEAEEPEKPKISARKIGDVSVKEMAAEARKRKRRKRAIQETYDATDEEKSLVDLWNRSDVVQEEGDRNLPVSDKAKRICWKKLKELLKTYSFDTIQREIQRYLDFCADDRNIRNGVNYAHKSLYQVLRKIEEHYERGGTCWWHDQIEDLLPKQTRYIADQFAQRFLDLDEFPLVTDSSEHYAFVCANERLTIMVQDNVLPMKFTKAVKLVMDCLEERSFKGPVYPGRLANSLFWTVDFPHFCKDRKIT